MKFSECIKPVSYVKAHAAEIIRKLNEEHADPMIITQNGEAKAVLMGVREYEEWQESLALMKILAISERDIEEGKFSTVDQVFKELEQRRLKRGA